MTLNERIHAWMSGREEEFVDALAPLVAIDSAMGEAAPGAPFGEGPARALEAALALADRWGLKTDRDEGYVGMVDLNDRPDLLHILAHLDIVAAGDGWDTDPFTLIRDGDIIYGRGTDDDKGPAVAAMLAMRCVKELGLPLRGNVRLLLGTDEETGSRDIMHYYSGHPFAPNAVTPDSCFPVTNVEKAHYSPKFTKSWAPQPDVPCRLVSLSGGIRINVAPSNCRAEIARMTAAEAAPALAAVENRTGVHFTAQETETGITVIAQGVPSHAAYPDGGKNAIAATLEALCSMPLAQDAAMTAVQQLHRLFPYGDNTGSALGIAMEDAVSGKLTVAFSLLELNETGVQGRFDCRAPLCSNTENTVLVTEGAFRAFGWDCTGSHHPAHHVDGNSPFIQTLLRCYEAFSGKKGFCEYTGGGTYVHGIPGGVAFGAGDHDFESNLHSANERAKLSQLLLTAEIYAAVIAELLA